MSNFIQFTHTYEFDTIAFLFVAILGCGFAAIELAGERVRGYHTISYLASIHPVLKWAIILSFALGGAIGAIWFYGHACKGCIVR